MKKTLVLVVLGLIGTSYYVIGDDAPVDPAQATAPGADQIAIWIEELGDSRFATRRDATDALVAAGLPAIEPVTNAALEGSAEVAVRCVQILRRLKDSSDAAVVEAATAGLQRLADSGNELVNERATAALDESSIDPEPIGGPAGGIQIQIQGGVFAAGNVSVETTVNNGQRTVTVNDNGKKIEITDQDGEDIQVTVTETVNGEEETSEYSANNVDDLTQNHPEIAELYEKYTQQNPIQFQVFAAQMQQIPIQQIQLPRQAFPVPFGPNGPIPAENDVNQQMAERIASAVDRLASVSARLAELTASENPDKNAMESLVEELNEIREELAGAQDELND